MRPADHIEACRTGHRRLLADLSSLVDADFRVPSLLPGYSRGHVVTHLANKAGAHVVLFEGAAAGEMRRVHPVGYDPDRAAAAGAGRSAAHLRADLTASLDLLEAAWDRFDDDLWNRRALMMAGPDIGYQVADWPSVFVDGELAKRLHALPDRADHAHLLGWLLDRAPAPDLVGPW